MCQRINEYLAYADGVRCLSRRTLDAYREDLRLFEDCCRRHDRDVLSAGAAEVRAFMAELVQRGSANASVNRALSAVKGLYRYLVRFKLCLSNPTRDIEGLPNPRRLPHFLFEQEMAEFLAMPADDSFCAARDKALFECMYSTGCRVSEIAAIRLAELDFDTRRVTVRGKGSKERVVFFSVQAIKAIAGYLPYRAARVKRDHPEVHLFINARGGALSPRGIAWLVERYALRSGLQKPLSPHGFRHSFATHLVSNGADIRTVQAMLGHESISTTQIYTHVNLEHLRAVYAKAHPHAARQRPKPAATARPKIGTEAAPASPGSLEDTP